MSNNKNFKQLVNVFDVLCELTNTSKDVEFAYFDFEDSGFTEEDYAKGVVDFKDSTNVKINETIYKTICNILILSDITFESDLCLDCCEFAFKEYTTFDFNNYELNKYLSK